MPDCSLCNRPLGRARWRCHRCGACEECCECEDGVDVYGWSAEELGLDPEDYADALQEQLHRREE